ncbi:MAG: FmdB family zinc ribbon protein [Desulfobacteraceae bacterium]
MPIYEFRCVECGRIFEKIFMSGDEEVELSCPDCSGTEIERVVSITNYAMGEGSGESQAKINSRSCGPGNSCATLELPGHSR